MQPTTNLNEHLEGSDIDDSEEESARGDHILKIDDEEFFNEGLSPCKGQSTSPDKKFSEYIESDEEKIDISKFIKRPEKRSSIHSEFAQIAMPLIKTGTSLQSDMKFGWKPNIEVSGAPIPLYYDFEPFEMPMNPLTQKEFEALYLGPRYKHSIAMHKQFANKSLIEKGIQSYTFNEPPNMGLINQIIKQTHEPEAPRAFLGMNPSIDEKTANTELHFDSNFESGNLDMVIKRKDLEYDLFMRVDTNTKGHHQWFYFSVINPKCLTGKKIRFNVANFTKNHSLYTQGLRICISKKSMNYTWQKGGEDIQYKTSHIMRQGQTKDGSQRQYYMLSFLYEFSGVQDKTYFSYCFPYDFSRLSNFLISQKLAVQSLQADYLKQTVLCKSLGGVDVPLLTITSRLNSDPENFQSIKLQEFQESYSRLSLPFYKQKKYVIICARVHPGESNSSYMMQGLIKTLLGSSLQAKELRKRCIFKIVPMSNPDGVIVGNYRTNIAGNDLNRKYHDPDEKLHPTVCAIKKLVSSIVYPNGEDEEPENDRIAAFIDMHGHSRKKNVFIYGPYYPLHHERYLRMRIIPKLLSEETTKFRFFSCKFRIERSKEKAARIVLWREYDIMNCFTFEASFHGYLNKDRQTEEFTPDILESMGEHLVNSLYEYFLILEEEDRQKKLKELSKKKKKKQQQLDQSQSQQMSLTASESFGKKRKKSVLTSTKASEQINALQKQLTKKVTPRIHLVNIQEEKEEDEHPAQGEPRDNIGIPLIIKQNDNPNEPSDTPPNRPPANNTREETKTFSQSLEGSLLSKKPANSGIRSIKQMFSILKADEQKRNQMIDEGDEDDTSDDNQNSPSKSRVDSGSDSDPLDGELNVEQQKKLHSNIKGAISQFQNYFNADPKKRKTSSDQFKLKKKKTFKDERNNKSPQPIQPNPTQKREEVQPSLKKPAIQQPEQQPNPPLGGNIKHKRSLPIMLEEQKSHLSSTNQKAKIQALITHTNIELFAKHKQQFAPITQMIGTQHYQQVKQTTFGLPQGQQMNQILKEFKQNLGGRIQFTNPLMINKIGIDQLANHEQQTATRIPNGQIRDQSGNTAKKTLGSAYQTKNYFLHENQALAAQILQNINMTGGLQIAGAGVSSTLPGLHYQNSGVEGKQFSAGISSYQLYKGGKPASKRSDREPTSTVEQLKARSGYRQKNNTPIQQTNSVSELQNVAQSSNTINQFNGQPIAYSNQGVQEKGKNSTQHDMSPGIIVQDRGKQYDMKKPYKSRSQRLAPQNHRIGGNTMGQGMDLNECSLFGTVNYSAKIRQGIESEQLYVGVQSNPAQSTKHRGLNGTDQNFNVLKYNNPLKSIVPPSTAGSHNPGVQIQYQLNFQDPDLTSYMEEQINMNKTATLAEEPKQLRPAKSIVKGRKSDKTILVQGAKIETTANQETFPTAKMAKQPSSQTQQIIEIISLQKPQNRFEEAQKPYSDNWKADAYISGLAKQGFQTGIMGVLGEQTTSGLQSARQFKQQQKAFANSPNIAGPPQSQAHQYQIASPAKSTVQSQKVNEKFLLASIPIQQYAASVYQNLEVQQQEIMKKALPSPSLQQQRRQSKITLPETGKQRSILNGSQLNQEGMPMIASNQHSREAISQHRKPSKHFDELQIPEPAYGKRARQSRTNKSFSAQQQQLDSSFATASLMTGGAKLVPIQELAPIEHKSSKHQKYQQIIDTLLNDQYHPVNVVLDMTSSANSIVFPHRNAV